MGEAPESSAAAVARAVALSCYVELDVCTTSDGVPLVIHPVSIDALLTDRPLTVGGRTLRYADVRSMRDRGGEVISRLDDILADNAGMRALIDVKQWPAVRPVARAVHATGTVKRLSICTFSQSRTNAVVAEIRTLTGYDICWGIGLGRTYSMAAPLLPRLRPFAFAGATIVQPPHRIVSQRFVDAAHQAGLAVFPWTVNKREGMRRLLRLGVDGVMTDYPSVLLDLIKSEVDRPPPGAGFVDQ
jgi:glycerophosphoryl diester phosphodiesterase